VVRVSCHSAAVLGQSVIETGEERWLRAYGSFPHPNVLAGFLIISIIFSFYLYSLLKKTYQKNILIVLCLILSAGLFFTFSRAGWLVFLIFTFFYIMKKKNVLASTCLILIIFLSIIYFPLARTRVMGTERLEIKSNIVRMSGYSQAGKIIKKYPLLGVGVGNYTVKLQKIYSGQMAWDYQPVHNVYLLMLAELGIINMLFFVFLMYLIFKNVFNYELIYIFFFLLLFDHFWWTLASGMLMFFLVSGWLKKPALPRY